jgi:hypothetical protein
MPTLVVASPPHKVPSGGALPWYAVFDNALASAAAAVGWRVVRCHADTVLDAVAEPALYVTTELALAVGRRWNLSLLEPPLDLLARVPERFTRRAVQFAAFADLERLRKPTFVKPADPLDKWFDAGVYSDVRDIRTKNRTSPTSPVLLSEPVEWTGEYRCFVLEGKLVTASPYLSFGRPAWHGAAPQPPEKVLPSPVRKLVGELCGAMRADLPPAFVVDVGVIDARGWAVVEFNPVWSAGLLAADPRAVLPMLLRTTRVAPDTADARWVVARP